MEVREIKENKKQFLELLLLADEQESMIDRYLERGEMYALYEEQILRVVCVVTKEAEDQYEIKNIATERPYQGMGYGKKMIEYICRHYKGRCRELLVGTGDSPLTIPFYIRCGFTPYGRVKNFFTKNYDHPIFEDGKQLVDMIYLKKELD